MEQRVYKVAVIGAGAAGLAAAIAAARAGVAVVLLEHMEQPAKKILATGNGHCNYTNLNLEFTNYYCVEPEFLSTVFEQVTLESVLDFFSGLGIRPVQKNGTCIYPESEQAASVRNVLLEECERLNIAVQTGIGIRRIEKKKDLFFLHTKSGVIKSHACVLATGGMAAPKTGSDGSGYLYAERLGHTVIDPVPALVALEADYKKYRLPAGVRILCAARLLLDAEPVAAESGELQITEYGISGIVIFQLSRLASRGLKEGRSVQVVLDFKPGMVEQELAQYLQERFTGVCLSQKTIEKGLMGFFPEKLIPVLLQKSGISRKEHWQQCSQEKKAQLVKAMKSYRLTITGTKKYDMAQATAGGIDIAQINPQTMESHLVGGLYFAGEILDVDGKCGGYNLHWAWATGMLAGASAVRSTG